MIELNGFAYFAAVAQHGGFTAAARATGIDKARLSRHVATLEDSLGVLLLRRSTRSVSLTEAGERFYSGCLAVLGSARAAFDDVAELQKEPSGAIRIGCPAAVAQNYLAPILPRYLAAHPKVAVIVEASERPLNPLEDNCDVVLSTMAESLPSTSLVARELGRIRRIVVAGPSFVEAHPDIAHPDDLAGLPLIARINDLHDGEARWVLTQGDDQPCRIHAVPRLAANDLRVQLDAVAQGMGIALLPEPIVNQPLGEGRVVRLLPSWSAPEYSLHLVYPLPRGMLPSVRSLINFLTSNLWHGRGAD